MADKLLKDIKQGINSEERSPRILDTRKKIGSVVEYVAFALACGFAGGVITGTVYERNAEQTRAEAKLEAHPTTADYPCNNPLYSRTYNDGHHPVFAVCEDPKTRKVTLYLPSDTKGDPVIWMPYPLGFLEDKIE